MNKNLLLASGLIALAVVLYVRKNKPTSNTIAPPNIKDDSSNMCGACSGANGENWGFEETKDWN